MQVAATHKRGIRFMCLCGAFYNLRSNFYKWLQYFDYFEVEILSLPKPWTCPWPIFAEDYCVHF